jgi:hypothetical protein
VPPPPKPLGTDEDTVVQLPEEEADVIRIVRAVTVPVVEVLPTAVTQSPVVSADADSLVVVVLVIEVAEEILTVVWLVEP